MALALPVTALHAACPPDRVTETARVRYVHDGDTLWLEDGRKLRLIGIDTPELARKGRPPQPYAEKARDKLRHLLSQADNRVTLGYGPERKDRYDRTLAHLYLANGDSVQAELLVRGLATAFTTPPNDSRSACYRQAESRAMSRKRGIWSLPRYRIKSLFQLDNRARGFRRIQGVVSNIRFGEKSVWIEIGHRPGKLLRLRINNRDLPNFDLHSLRALQGKTLRVRGWLHPGKDHMFMSLRHRDALTILKTAE